MTWWFFNKTDEAVLRWEVPDFWSCLLCLLKKRRDWRGWAIGLASWAGCCIGLKCCGASGEAALPDLIRFWREPGALTFLSSPDRNESQVFFFFLCCYFSAGAVMAVPLGQFHGIWTISSWEVHKQTADSARNHSLWCGNNCRKSRAHDFSVCFPPAPALLALG